jgi:hypothetical protein
MVHWLPNVNSEIGGLGMLAESGGKDSMMSEV